MHFLDTLQTTFKYFIITLQADNHGEGGVFSLYALVHQCGKNPVYPAIIGAGTLLADGIITPPITVTSAIEGLGMVHGMEQHIVLNYVFPPCISVNPVSPW